MSNSYFRSFSFLCGLVLRLIVIVTIIPQIHLDLWLPFAVSLLDELTIDVWSSFLNGGGDPRAFPYGLPYVLVYAVPLATASVFTNDLVILSKILFCIVLVLELSLLTCFSRWQSGRSSRMLRFYWLNPAVIYVCYWHGQLDILPVFLVVISLFYATRRRYFFTGLFIGLATTAKFSMALTLPFILIWFFRDAKYRPWFWIVTAGMSIGLVPMVMSLFSEGYQEMVIGTPEALKIFALRVPVHGSEILLLPLAIAAILLGFWNIKRYTTNVVVAFLCLSFLTIYLLTPASPGWSLWFLPLYALLINGRPFYEEIVAFLFSISVAAYHIYEAPNASHVEHFDFSGLSGPQFEALGTSYLVLSNTLLFAIGGLLAYYLLVKCVLQSPFFRATRSPLMFLIAGDSGSGKDTLAHLIAGLFGRHRTVNLSGDDYHLWDRKQPMWNSVTHLDPAANDLTRYYLDLQILKSMNPVMVRHYDHAIGKATKPIRVLPRDVLIGSGLHALLEEHLRGLADISIFMEMNENLRRYLKVSRDVNIRGHDFQSVMASINRRGEDSERFILPQRKTADLIFTLMPCSEIGESEIGLRGGFDHRKLELKLQIGFRSSSIITKLEQVLVGGVNAKVQGVSHNDAFYFLEVECDATAAEVASCADNFFSDVLQLCELDPEFRGGLDGIMQLAILIYLADISLDQLADSGSKYE